MEHTICAPADGTVREFYFQAGEQVSGGDELLEFDTGARPVRREDTKS